MKGLVISWYFPPINSSEGLVTFKLLKNSNYTYDVFTQKNNKSWTYGAEEKKLISKNINTIFGVSKNINEWVNEGIAFFEKNKDKYDFIMSRSMAPESHEIALAIKQKYPNIKWIASFGDPIKDNPYELFTHKSNPNKVLGNGLLDYSIKYIFSPKRILKSILWEYRTKTYIKNNTRELRDKKLQDDVFEYADRIILNNQYQKNHMLKSSNIKEDKVIVLPHTFDEDFYNYKLSNKNDKIVMSYIGHCDDIRTPKPLLDAIKRLKETIPNLNEKLIVNFYGNFPNMDKIVIIDNQIEDIVKVNKPVTYFDSLDIMRKSNWLLLIDANLSRFIDKNIFFAAKIADYLGSKRNILGITMYDGASADILRKTDNIVSSHSVEEIYINLLSIINGKIKEHDYNADEYNAKNVAKIYDNMVKELIKVKNEKN